MASSGEEVRLLEEALDDPNETVRVAAARALGSLKAFSSARRIAMLLGDSDSWLVQYCAVEALAALRAREFAGDFVRLLEQTESPPLRALVAKTLGRPGSEIQLPALERAFAKESAARAHVCLQEAIQAITSMGDR